MYLWNTNFTVKVSFSCSNFLFFFVLTKIFVQCNSQFCTTKLDSFYNTLDLFYFHKVFLICSADNIFMRKVIIIHCIYMYIYIYTGDCISDLVMYPEIFNDNACIWGPPCSHGGGWRAKIYFEFNTPTLLEKTLKALPTQIKFEQPFSFLLFFSRCSWIHHCSFHSFF